VDLWAPFDLASGMATAVGQGQRRETALASRPLKAVPFLEGKVTNLMEKRKICFCLSNRRLQKEESFIPSRPPRDRHPRVCKKG